MDLGATAISAASPASRAAASTYDSASGQQMGNVPRHGPTCLPRDQREAVGTFSV